MFKDCSRFLHDQLKDTLTEASTLLDGLFTPGDTQTYAMGLSVMSAEYTPGMANRPSYSQNPEANHHPELHSESQRG